MTKLIISIVVSLAILLGFGIFEAVLIESRFTDLNKEIAALIPKAQEEKISVSDFDPTFKKWEELRHVSELFLTHADIHEVNMRMRECMACIENKDYNAANVQLSVLTELTEYIPRNVAPALRNII